LNMFPQDPVTLESLRYLLTFEKAQNILNEFKAAEATFHEGIRRLEESQATFSRTSQDADRAARQIRKAVLEAKEAANWDRVVQELSEAVHFNGYVALEKLVDESLDSSVQKMKALLQETTTAMYSSIENLQSAVAGKPQLPITPPGSSVTERAVAFTQSIWVRFRRMCIDALPVLVLGCFILQLAQLSNALRTSLVLTGV
jgi:hypothetical protein